MQKNKYHVLIIGAGPSGLSTALNLQKLGIKDILVIEQYKFPRYKCCAGYITNKTKKYYEKLGLDISKCHYSLIEDFKIYYNLKLKQTIINKFLYTNKQIERTELDYEFYKTAISNNINIKENAKIIKHNLRENELTLSTNETINYDYLVFADGTLGFGSQYQKTSSKNIAMQVTFSSKFKNSINIHFGITQNGYAWVSNYNGTTNVGITDVYNPKNNYNLIFKEFLKKLNISCDLKDLKGSFTPIGTRKGVINKNVYFVGDAAGACDPLTLSGLRYGLKSGEVCAKAITKQNNHIYKRYINILKIKFIIVNIILKIFYLKFILFIIFNVGCRFFSKIISYIFNHFFVGKK